MAAHTETTEPEETYRPDADTRGANGLLAGSSGEGVGLEGMLEWVEENQTLAMLGAFALGVFVGVLMRE